MLLLNKELMHRASLDFSSVRDTSSPTEHSSETKCPYVGSTAVKKSSNQTKKGFAGAFNFKSTPRLNNRVLIYASQLSYICTV